MRFRTIKENQGEQKYDNLVTEVYKLALETGNIHQENIEDGCSLSHLYGVITEPKHILGFSHIIEAVEEDSEDVAVGYLKLEGWPDIIAGIHSNKNKEQTEINILLLDSERWNNVQACESELLSNSNNQLERVAASIGIRKEVTDSGIRVYDSDDKFETKIL